MADWRNLALALAVADGKVSDRETNIIRQEVVGKDGRLDRSELEFLLEVKRRAASVAPAFTEFLNKALKKMLLGDGTIGPDEVRWLRQWIFADGKVSTDERTLLHDLRREAKMVCPEFVTLYDQAMRA